MLRKCGIITGLVGVCLLTLVSVTSVYGLGLYGLGLYGGLYGKHHIGIGGDLENRYGLYFSGISETNYPSLIPNLQNNPVSTHFPIDADTLIVVDPDNTSHSSSDITPNSSFVVAALLI